MFFKSWKMALFSCLLIPLVSCTIGEPKRVSEAQSVESHSKLGCLKNFAKELAGVLDGTLGADTIRTLDNCTVESVKEFAKLMVGKEQGEFTPTEIRDFLQKYYLEDFKVSDELLHQLLRVKESYFGGGVATFTAEDLTQLLRTTHTLFEILKKFQPFFPLSFEAIEAMPEEKHSRFLAALSEASDSFSALLISKNAKPYTFGEFRVLLHSLDSQFIKVENHSFVAGTLDRLNWIKNIKSAFIEPASSEDDLTVSGIKILLKDGAELIPYYLTAQRIFKAEGLELSADGRRRLMPALNGFLAFLDRVIDRNLSIDPRGLSLDKVKDIALDPVVYTPPPIPGDKDNGPTKLQTKTIIKIFDTLLGRLLGQNHKELRKIVALNHEHIAGLRRIIREAQILKTWGDLKEEEAGGPVSRALLVDNSAAEMAQLKKSLPFEMNAEDESRLTSYRMYLKNNPAIYTDHKDSVMTPEMYFRPFTRFELNVHTLMRSFLGALVRGYSEDLSDLPSQGGKGSGINVSEFTVLVRDLWDILIDLKLLSHFNIPENDAKKRLREASIFCFASDGDEFLSINEGEQLILGLAEAKPLAQAATKLAKAKCEKGPPDEFGVSVIEPKCYRKTIFDFDNKNEESRKLWANFPKLREYFTALPDKEKEEFRFLLEIPGRKRGYQEKVWFSSDDTESVTALIRYVETIIVRFDQNPQNGTLGMIDAKFAFPVFQRELSSFRPDLDPPTLYAAFTWLLANGGEPVSDQMGFFRRVTNGAQFLWWKYRGESNWEFESTRRNLISVFGVISEASPAPVGSLVPIVSTSSTQ